MKTFLLFCSFVLMSVAKINNDFQVSVMRVLSAKLGKMVLDCQVELEFTQEVINDLLDFWNEKNNLTSPDLGCALVCVLEKNQFLSPDGSEVQKDIVDAFFEEAGADDVLSGQMVDLLVLCRKQTKSIKNFCDSALEMARCFRYGIFTVRWNPERFYWKHSQLPNSKHKIDTKKC